MVISFQVLDHFQISPGPLHHQLRLLWPHLPLQHGCLWGGDPEELLPAGHRGSAGRPQGLEGGPGGDGALLPAGSHQGPGISHPWHLLCAHALPLHHPQLPPRSGPAPSWAPWAWVGKVEEAGGSLAPCPMSPTSSQPCHALPFVKAHQAAGPSQSWSWAWLPTRSTPPAMVFLQGSHSLARGHYPLRTHLGQMTHLKHGEILLQEQE